VITPGEVTILPHAAVYSVPAMRYTRGHHLSAEGNKLGE